MPYRNIKKGKSLLGGPGWVIPCWTILKAAIGFGSELRNLKMPFELSWPARIDTAKSMEKELQGENPSESGIKLKFLENGSHSFWNLIIIITNYQPQTHPVIIITITKCLHSLKLGEVLLKEGWLQGLIKCQMQS